MPKPSLRPDETEIETHRANRSQGSRAVGGHLLLTDQRLVFYAHKFDSSTGGQDWECALTSISDVDVAPRGWHPFNGEMRRRLRVDYDGTIERFVVNHVQRIVAAIDRARTA